jgi:hypothetical protein
MRCHVFLRVIPQTFELEEKDGLNRVPLSGGKRMTLSLDCSARYYPKKFRGVWIYALKYPFSMIVSSY